MQRLRIFHLCDFFYKNIPQALESLPKEEAKHVIINFSNARLNYLPKKRKCVSYVYQK